MSGRGGKRSTSFKPGRSGNPGGRPKAIGIVQELARQHTPRAIDKLADIMRNSQSDSAKIAAAKELLDRGWGKPAQFSISHQGEFKRAIDMTDDELIAIATDRH
jgi:hypothetical protein